MKIQTSFLRKLPNHGLLQLMLNPELRNTNSSNWRILFMWSPRGGPAPHKLFSASISLNGITASHTKCPNTLLYCYQGSFLRTSEERILDNEEIHSVQPPMYDAIAANYQASKQLPFRTCIEMPTLFSLLGDIHEKTVLDLACGDGFYSRKLKQLGAKTVIGVDISNAMIQLANQQEITHPLGCQYIVHDVATLGQLGEFDIVLGSYLLNYAKTPDELAQFCTTIFRNLKPGGCFVGFNNNPTNPVSTFQTYKKYGFWKSIASDTLTVGSPITYHNINPDGTEFSFDNYYLPPEVHELLFYQTGFTLFKWCDPILSETGRKNFEPEYWNDFLRYPPVIGILAYKRNSHER